MKRREKVELFEQIRREYEFGAGTIKGVARKLGVHRRMVRQALADTQPPERKRSERERPVVGPLVPFIDAILEADRKAPRKQRHTAHRIWQRISAACNEDEQRQIAGRSQPVGAAMIEERAHLLPLAEQGFELAEVCFPRVDGLGCVRVRTNLYSVAVKPDKTVEVRLYPDYVEVRDEGRCIARHERSYGVSSKCSTWSITWMCWSASRVRWLAQSHSPRGGKEDCGRRVTIGYWKS
jgi:hypothetical protein